MNKSQILAQKQEFNNQYIFFKVAHILGVLVTWSYFSVLLLRNADSPTEAVPFVIIHHALLSAGLVIGFVLGAKLIPVYGYLKTFRISNALEMIVGLIALLTLNNISSVYTVISLLMGVGRGVFWNTHHMFNTTEIGQVERSKFLSVTYSIEQLLGVIMPILIGSVLTVMGYQIVFIVGSMVYLVAMVYPWKFNKIPQDSLSGKDFNKLSKQRGFKRWIFLVIFEGFTSNSRAVVISVVPFLFIGNEFGVGALGTLMGLLGALTTFGHRNDNYNNKVSQGLFGSALIYISTLGLLAFWSLPALVIRSLVSQFGLAFYSPIEAEINFHLKEMLLGDFKNKLALETQQLSELSLFIGRMSSTAIFIFGFYSLGIRVEVMLMFLLGISLIREPFIIMFSKYITNDIKNHRHSHSDLTPQPRYLAH